MPLSDEPEDWDDGCPFIGTPVGARCFDGEGCACLAESDADDPERFRIVRGLLAGTLMYRGSELRTVTETDSIDNYDDREGGHA